MAMNRMQFHPGLSMAEFMDRCGGDANAANDATFGWHWP